MKALSILGGVVFIAIGGLGVLALSSAFSSLGGTKAFYGAVLIFALFFMVGLGLLVDGFSSGRRNRDVVRNPEEAEGGKTSVLTPL